MTSTAISAQGTLVQIGTGSGGAKTITSVSLANPASVGSTAHGFSPGDRVTIAAIVGTVQLNGNVYTVEYVTTNSFILKGVNSTGYTAYTSGGTATPVTFSSIGNVKGFDGFDGSASVLDKSNFQSTAKEKALGLVDNGQVSYDLDLDLDDAGQIAAMAHRDASSQAQFKIILPGFTTPNIAFAGFVMKFTHTGKVDALLTAKIDIMIDGAVART